MRGRSSHSPGRREGARERRAGAGHRRARGAKLALVNRKGKSWRGSGRARSAAPSSAASSPARAIACAPGSVRTRELTVSRRALRAAEHEGLQAEAPQERLRLPDHARRHEARDRRPPPDRRRARTPRSSSTPATATPTRPARRAASPDRQPARLRGRRREHARHRLLGRRVRLLRAAAGPRRLRRDRDGRPPAVGREPQGRDDGHLLRRHQPALRGEDAPAAPGGDHPAVGDRRHGERRSTRAGILNTGFALEWAKDRVHDALPASATGGQGWALAADQERATRRARPTRRCTPRRSTSLKQDPHEQRTTAPRSPTRCRRRSSSTRSTRRSFLACQCTDEQTGGHCAGAGRAASPARRRSGSPSPTASTPTRSTRRRSTAGSTSSSSTSRKKAPQLPAGDRGLAPGRSTARPRRPRREAAGRPDPGDRRPTTRRTPAFEAQPRRAGPVRQRRRAARPGAPFPGFEQSFSGFPVAGDRRALVVLRGGRRAARPRPPTPPGPTRSRGTRRRARPTDFTGDTGSRAGCGRRPRLQLGADPGGHRALVRDARRSPSPPTVIGAGARRGVDQDGVPSVDLQATVTEVRPDGKETFVQSGWLRASERKLDHRKSTPLEPVPTLRKRDAAPLPKGRWRRSRSRSTTRATPTGPARGSGSRSARRAATSPCGRSPSRSRRSRRTWRSRARRTMPSRLVLPVVPGVSVPTALPPCPGLRGEPCRATAPIVNRAG